MTRRDRARALNKLSHHASEVADQLQAAGERQLALELRRFREFLRAEASQAPIGRSTGPESHRNAA